MGSSVEGQGKSTQDGLVLGSRELTKLVWWLTPVNPACIQQTGREVQTRDSTPQRETCGPALASQIVSKRDPASSNVEGRDQLSETSLDLHKSAVECTCQ